MTHDPRARSETWARNVLLPALSFILGIVTAALLQDYLNHRNLTLIILIVISCLLIGLIALSTFMTLRSDQGFNSIQAVLNKATLYNGLHATYVEDGLVGESYRRSTELIKAARESITFIDIWEPFEGYQTESEDLKAVRLNFYQTILEQVRAHRQDATTFHRRIVQVPGRFLESRVPFEADPTFQDYLLEMCVEQATHPRTCRLKIAPVQIRTHFIIVDRRYIIIPLLSIEPDGRELNRHGALFFDDRSGDLYKGLVGIYQAIDAHSRAMERRDLTLPVSIEEATRHDVSE